MPDQAEINPYAPPAAGLDAPAPEIAVDRFDRPLFSPGQIAVATFFGSLLAGVLLLQKNFRVMRRSKDANLSLGLGLLAFGALVPLLLIVPKGIETVLNIGVASGMSSIARSLQGPAFSRHKRAGGARRSNWLVFAMIVASLAAIFLTAAIVTIVTGALYGDLLGP